MHDASFETLLVNVDDNAIAYVEMNRPEKMNAMNQAFWRELPEAIASLGEMGDVRVIVLTGRGKHFTSGIDLSDPALMLSIGDNGQEDPGRVRFRLREKILKMQDTFTALESCRVPIIAAIHGACIGGGFDLVTACDLRLATENAFFSIQEVNIGMVADVGTLQRAPHLLPHTILRELAYTGRRMGAQEAAGYGFLNAVLADEKALLEAAKALALQIAAKSPLAISGTKKVLNHAREHSIAEGLDYVATWNAGMLISQDMMKGAQAVMSKKEATFDDLLE